MSIAKVKTVDSVPTLISLLDGLNNLPVDPHSLYVSVEPAGVLPSYISISIPGKGQGLIGAQDIPKGSRILSLHSPPKTIQ
jgi:hypothetical protein